MQMQRVAYPAFLPPQIRYDMIRMGPQVYHWGNREFEVVVVPGQFGPQLDVVELRYQPSPFQPMQGPAKPPEHHFNLARAIAWGAVGLGALAALFGAATAYYHPLHAALPGLAIAAGGGIYLAATKQHK